MMGKILRFLTALLLVVIPVNSVCLNYLSCYNEHYLDYSLITIHHIDLDVRSADACGRVCEEEQPDATLVFAKVVEVNERLVCGCGDEGALGNSSGTVNDFFGCARCPEGDQKCGGRETVSVYQLFHTDGGCDDVKDMTTTPATSQRPQIAPATTQRPQTPTTTELMATVSTSLATYDLDYLGCFPEDDVAGVSLVVMSGAGATLEACHSSCLHQHSDNTVALIRRNGTDLLCGCGDEGVLKDARPVDERVCSEVCGVWACGGSDTFSVYSSGWRPVLSLLLVLSALATTSLH